MNVDLTESEARVIELLRIMKLNRGHGTLHIEVASGAEKLFTRETKELPPLSRGVDKL